MKSKSKLILIAGARPNFMKVAPLMNELNQWEWVEPILVHTGQHYDPAMSDLFFNQLQIPEPRLNLGVGSGTHATQTANIMVAFEPVLDDIKPNAVVVVGDVNSTIACGLTAVKKGISLFHVEAGLRSRDRTMPEEINRVLTDSISDLLFCTEQSGVDHLKAEGIADEKIHLTGNVMIDTLLKFKEKAEATSVLQDLHLTPHGYGVMTLHRPSNVDDPEILQNIMNVVERISGLMPVVFPVHPRTRQHLKDVNLKAMEHRVKILDPLGYLEFIGLLSRASVVLTDSGGIQEETTILKVPCLTLRENTERPVTVEMGSNQIVGLDPERIYRAFESALTITPDSIHTPPGWDGNASRRIVDIIRTYLCK